MSMRKSIPPGNIPPGGARLVAKPSNATTEYIEAVNFLRDDTLNQACRLLLSEADYLESASEKKKSDYEELLEIYSKCVHAVKVIHRDAPAEISQAPAVPFPRPNLVASRAQAKPLGKPVAVPSITIPPSRRMARLPAGKVMPPRQQKLQREESDSSADVRAGPTSAGVKRPRMAASPTPSSDSNHGAGAVQAPPQSALKFLAKLNKDGSNDTKEKPAVKSTTTAKPEGDKPEILESPKRRRPSPVKYVEEDTEEEEEEEDEDEEQEEEQEVQEEEQEQEKAASRKTPSPTPPAARTRNAPTRVQPTRVQPSRSTTTSSSEQSAHRVQPTRTQPSRASRSK